jgi:hypothetical protein
MWAALLREALGLLLLAATATVGAGVGRLEDDVVAGPRALRMRWLRPLLLLRLATPSYQVKRRPSLLPLRRRPALSRRSGGRRRPALALWLQTTLP